MQWIPTAITGLCTILVALIEAHAAKERKRTQESEEEKKEKMARAKAVEEGVLALLRDRIIERYNHYMEQEYIPIYGMENVLSMYAAYHVLGGNGTVTGLVQDLKGLPHDPADKSQ